MIVSHKFKFIFIKTRKTAGTSLEVFLSGACGPSDVVTPVIPPESGHVPRNHEGFYNHIPASEARLRLVDCWDSYFKFCVERNPWDKVLSSFRWSGGRDFGSFLEDAELPADGRLYMDGDRLLVDRVVRYENLDRELGEVFGDLGVEFRELAVRAKPGLPRNYRDFYTPAQRDLVAERFAREIAMFGYSF